MANSRKAKLRRMKRKHRYANLIASGEADFWESEGQGCYSSFLPENTECSSVGSQASIPSHFEDQKHTEYCTYKPHEYLLSDHASVDMLILDNELKNVLTDLEKLGILEDDYRSLALTKDDEEEQKVDDSNTIWPPLVVQSEERKLEDEDESEQKNMHENDWEVLSSADSVWTVETFSDQKTFKKVVTENHSSLVEHPVIHTTPVEMITTMPGRTETIVDLAMLDTADVWSSIRDTIKSLGRK
jgi:hypothetical protein